jgi:hypothetical protein
MFHPPTPFAQKPILGTPSTNAKPQGSLWNRAPPQPAPPPRPPACGSQVISKELEEKVKDSLELCNPSLGAAYDHLECQRSVRETYELGQQRGVSQKCIQKLLRPQAPVRPRSLDAGRLHPTRKSLSDALTPNAVMLQNMIVAFAEGIQATDPDSLNAAVEKAFLLLNEIKRIGSTRPFWTDFGRISGIVKYLPMIVALQRRELCRNDAENAREELKLDLGNSLESMTDQEVCVLYLTKAGFEPSEANKIFDEFFDIIEKTLEIERNRELTASQKRDLRNALEFDFTVIIPAAEPLMQENGELFMEWCGTFPYELHDAYAQLGEKMDSRTSKLYIPDFWKTLVKIGESDVVDDQIRTVLRSWMTKTTSLADDIKQRYSDVKTMDSESKNNAKKAFPDYISRRLTPDAPAPPTYAPLPPTLPDAAPTASKEPLPVAGSARARGPIDNGSGTCADFNDEPHECDEMPMCTYNTRRNRCENATEEQPASLERKQNRTKHTPKQTGNYTVTPTWQKPPDEPPTAPPDVPHASSTSSASDNTYSATKWTHTSVQAPKSDTPKSDTPSEETVPLIAALSTAGSDAGSCVHIDNDGNVTHDADRTRGRHCIPSWLDQMYGEMFDNVLLTTSLADVLFGAYAMMTLAVPNAKRTHIKEVFLEFGDPDELPSDLLSPYDLSRVRTIRGTLITGDENESYPPHKIRLQVEQPDDPDDIEQCYKTYDCFLDGNEKPQTVNRLEKLFKQKCALKYHPDKNPGEDATEKYQDAANCFEKLKTHLERQNRSSR